jgi:hypothetical protein
MNSEVKIVVLAYANVERFLIGKVTMDDEYLTLDEGLVLFIRGFTPKGELDLAPAMPWPFFGVKNGNAGGLVKYERKYIIGIPYDPAPDLLAVYNEATSRIQITSTIKGFK